MDEANYNIINSLDYEQIHWYCVDCNIKSRGVFRDLKAAQEIIVKLKDSIMKQNSKIADLESQTTTGSDGMSHGFESTLNVILG